MDINIVKIIISVDNQIAVNPYPSGVQVSFRREKPEPKHLTLASKDREFQNLPENFRTLIPCSSTNFGTYFHQYNKKFLYFEWYYQFKIYV